MPIPVRCPCQHEWDVAEGEAGDGVMCPECGREVIVPVPKGLDVDKARDDARRAAAEQPPPSKAKSLAEGLGTWVDQTFVQRRLFTVATLLVLIVVIPVLIWAVATISRTLKHGQAVHYGKGVDDELGTKEMRERMRQDRIYRERLEAGKKAKEAADKKGEASEAGTAAGPAELLAQAKELKEEGKSGAARGVLQQVIDTHPESAEAKEARTILKGLPAAPK